MALRSHVFLCLERNIHYRTQGPLLRVNRALNTFEVNCDPVGTRPAIRCVAPAGGARRAGRSPRRRPGPVTQRTACGPRRRGIS
jgi:hypothetical protein